MCVVTFRLLESFEILFELIFEMSNQAGLHERARRFKEVTIGEILIEIDQSQSVICFSKLCILSLSINSITIELI